MLLLSTKNYDDNFTLKPRAMENKTHKPIFAAEYNRSYSLNMIAYADHENRFQKKSSSDDQQLKKQEEIISIASHELKSPITSAKLLLSLLEKLTKNEENQRLLELVQKAEIQIDRLIELVNNLQDMAALQDGNLSLKKEAFDFSNLLNNCTDTFRMQNTVHEIQINTLSEIKICADAARIEQVLINFISNAIKYSPEGGCINIDVETTAETLKVMVTDAGIGVPEADLPYVFDCYFRSQQSVKNIKGSGLGLYICKQIIVQHQGEIGAISKENEGSTFWFSLPINIK